MQPFKVDELASRIAVSPEREALLGLAGPDLDATAGLGFVGGLLPQFVTDPGTHSAEEDPGFRFDHPAAQVPLQARRDSFQNQHDHTAPR